ncbi:LamG domain-containing protein [Lysinibacillus sp. NPDC048646]|uniref:LamG domain-containing protein n=1 Tax=Lysinibacillus sp. NPDC048646 TaxID=3390574 RepID=UPI003D071D22
MATTEQLMLKHGVAWFGFDEQSGNVYDKLGSDYIGAVTGATRVEGWNGEGRAINFNGTNQYIQFNSSVIPRGEKTIRFKMKSGQTTSGRILVDYAIANSIGWFIHVTDSKLTVEVYTGVSNIASYVISDNFWHDVFITYDGNKLKLYVDDMINPKQIVNTIEMNWTTTLCRIGTGSNERYYSGQLDDLQIYNKALSPSDFTQKRLAIKTADNKNLVLSPTSNRVKEIPNTAEYMMLAQGGIVKEIDSAIDRPPIDFTKSTTEYEIVTNNRTPLGKGRILTIPISGDFKTAMIEDNY